jgi:hypothetical protein
MADDETQSETAPPAMGNAETVILDLQDLLPDSGGEIVLRGAGLGLVISTGQAVTATGTADGHVTASGEDVSGYRYYQLDGGITLYCEADASLMLNATLV